jgi:hypothetical protein
MLIHQYDPSSYINNLFTNIVDTKNMQGLVIYGVIIIFNCSMKQNIEKVLVLVCNPHKQSLFKKNLNLSLLNKLHLALRIYLTKILSWTHIKLKKWSN